MKAETFALGLAGYPLEHSLSPRMHNAALRALGLAGEYRLFPVPPLPEGAGQLARLLERVRQGEVHGLNVTIPHKQAVLPLLDGLSAEAQAIGAANTILLDGSRLVGYNTDAEGFLTDLRRFLPSEKLAWGEPRAPAQTDGLREYRESTLSVFDEYSLGPPALPDKPPQALVLGAGGSARAVVYALACSGWQVCVSARRIEQAQFLCESLLPFLGPSSRPENAPPLRAVPWRAERVPSRRMEFASESLIAQREYSLIDPAPVLIVNTTPVGMVPHVGISPWPTGQPFPAGAVVYDLVYNPAETALIRSARQAGLRAENGLGMLLEQAALSFERWTGRPAPREVMRAAVLSYNSSGRKDE